jgi:hypothetical protein
VIGLASPGDRRGIRWRRDRAAWQIPWSMRALSSLVVGSLALGFVLAPAPAWAEAPAHDFIAEAKALLVVGACADGATPTGIKPEVVADHCKVLRVTQDDYVKSWLTPATAFFAANVPAAIPKTVVYPFAGGDLSTALTVYPNADEITTLSLEPAGDPLALGMLPEKELKGALNTIEKELSQLYKANFSITMNMINAMRSGALPTQLVFGLSALWLHGYEPVSLRYFKLTADGEIRYVTDEDLVRIAKLKGPNLRNREFASIELRFRKKGTTREQIYRHIQANLDDAHIKAFPGALRHLEKKGQVAAMTKAASYLLTFDDFKDMRKYLIDHVVWMVSDTTGIAPSYGKPAGFEYETWGEFEYPNMNAGYSIAPVWRAEYKAQPKRPLPFRFGYPDRARRGHLIIMRKAANPPAAPAAPAPVKPAAPTPAPAKK